MKKNHTALWYIILIILILFLGIYTAKSYNQYKTTQAMINTWINKYSPLQINLVNMYEYIPGNHNSPIPAWWSTSTETSWDIVSVYHIKDEVTWISFYFHYAIWRPLNFIDDIVHQHVYPKIIDGNNFIEIDFWNWSISKLNATESVVDWKSLIEAIHKNTKTANNKKLCELEEYSWKMTIDSKFSWDRYIIVWYVHRRKNGTGCLFVNADRSPIFIYDRLNPHKILVIVTQIYDDWMLPNIWMDTITR